MFRGTLTQVAPSSSLDESRALGMGAAASSGVGDVERASRRAWGSSWAWAVPKTALNTSLKRARSCSRFINVTRVVQYRPISVSGTYWPRAALRVSRLEYPTEMPARRRFSMSDTTKAARSTPASRPADESGLSDKDDTHHDDTHDDDYHWYEAVVDR